MVEHFQPSDSRNPFAADVSGLPSNGFPTLLGYIRVVPPFMLSDQLAEDIQDASNLEVKHYTTSQHATLLEYELKTHFLRDEGTADKIREPLTEAENSLAESYVRHGVERLLEILGYVARADIFDAAGTDIPTKIKLNE